MSGDIIGTDQYRPEGLVFPPQTTLRAVNLIQRLMPVHEKDRLRSGLAGWPTGKANYPQQRGGMRRMPQVYKLTGFERVGRRFCDRL